MPIVLLAYSGGPPPRVTGAPGDQTCNQVGCHVGTAVNGGGGNVAIAVDGGNTYTPGGTKRITLTITDANARAYGFQASARLASNERTAQAGTFVPGSQQFVQCEDGRERPSGGCPSSASIEFIEHTSPFSTNTISFQWTAPATASGEVRIYVATNAANGNGTQSGDHIYTANVTLTPQASGGGQRPAISQGGVSENFNGLAGVASGTWIAIFGQNFASGNKTWDNEAAFQQGTPEFNANTLPQSIDGVRVTVNGKPAAVYFVSATQINILAPTDDATGDVQVRVTTSAGESDPITVRKSAVLPSIVAPFRDGNRLFAVGVTPAGELISRAGIATGVARGFKPGEVVQLFGSGFGPTNPAVDASTARFTAAPVSGTAIIRFGDTQAEIVGGQGFLISPGLYQYNVRVPDIPNGDVRLRAEIGGVQSSDNVFVTIER
ncbi:MAG TPA: choice-of-anchor V domain-containing protein [Bryobacteraceae bacterium]|nr:choice-of-anchor V domain-containing protein [Bryobacteraceae bacterium]